MVRSTVVVVVGVAVERISVVLVVVLGSTSLPTLMQPAKAVRSVAMNRTTKVECFIRFFRIAAGGRF